jgi:hypothetical protein
MMCLICALALEAPKKTLPVEVIAAFKDVRADDRFPEPQRLAAARLEELTRQAPRAAGAAQDASKQRAPPHDRPPSRKVAARPPANAGDDVVAE